MSTGAIFSKYQETMSSKIRPFLMFLGQAEEAMNFYVSLFRDSEILDVIRYKPGEPGPEGTVKKASFRIGDQSVLCTDSFVKHDFTFTPSFSLFVQCDSDDEIQRLASAFLEGGTALMPLGEYGFSRRFAWINDRYGVSWQLNLD
jgi:predicted 3-demethylubiquinone-9 3-methyltransferase (glyoxalase superfamily)